MKRSAELHPHARIELIDATTTYSAESEALAKRFYRQVKLALRNACVTPLRYPIIIDDYRRVVLAKFPYIVVYRVTESAIYVIAVAHSKREPNYWATR